MRRLLWSFCACFFTLFSAELAAQEYSLKDGSRLTYEGASAARIGSSSRVMLTLRFTSRSPAGGIEGDRFAVMNKLNAEAFEICRSHAGGLIEGIRDSNPQMNFAVVEIALTKKTKSVSGTGKQISWEQQFSLSDGKCADPL